MAEMGYPNFAGEAMARSAQMKRRLDMDKRDLLKKPLTNGTMCVNCKKECEKNVFTCRIHKLSFCEYCVKNYNQREIEREKSVHCESSQDECIWEKVEIYE